ncbi:3-dehydroquinate synthase [Ferruginibacter sp. HRS2-29]|uniref:3-dehydroquinate synthase n=1 Tax=Ferruginibacter sp. HRS2-29 TaxID=2487334 RepID=UPI0020CBA9B0|nr:3-dehydroquinate synthase [Ferruginibacter sp. HRS2-29]MCP9751421.1 3-dehydroquinate synthase [Ferruginibacter sp. HRS2-29]
MKEQTHLFSNKSVNYIFGGNITGTLEQYDREKIVIITDENVHRYHHGVFEKFRTIVLKAGEQYKTQQTVDGIIVQLLEMQADKNTVIVGVGGGVVTDMAGYAASIFKRGVRLVLVPTSILAMVDAAVGGKNGVDVGVYKNMVGTVYQPEIILFDHDFLKTLPYEEWVNGFAEVIKHACIKDRKYFEFLEQHELQDFMDDGELIADLIMKNVGIKTAIVIEDEFETGERKLLNFGHTLGHAIENIYHLPHGHAVSIGMMAACTISEEIKNFPSEDKGRVKALLLKYQLPVKIKYETEKIWKVLLMDKKRQNDSMSFVLLRSIGDGIIQSIPLVQLHDLLDQGV